MKIRELTTIDEHAGRSRLMGVGTYAKGAASLLLAAAAVVAGGVFVGRASAADVVRYLAPNAAGAMEERSAEGRIGVEDVDKDGIGIHCDSEKTAPDENPIPTERVLWTQYQDAPLALGAVRVEIEVGNYEEALQKLNDIQEDEINREKYPLVAAEYDWYKASAALRLALIAPDSADIVAAGNATRLFIKNYPESYHYYDACLLLADASYQRSAAAKKEEKASLLKSANGAYGQLTKAASPELQTRGKLGLARVALDSGSLDEALNLFTEAAEQKEFVVEYSEAQIGVARTTARMGDPDRAAEILTALLKETPNDSTLRQARIYNALGDVCADAERTQEAVVAYLHVDLLYPAARAERVYALKALVTAWRKLNRDDRAQETIERLKNRFNVTVE